MRKYLQLLRIKNYVKNFLIFFPFIFSGRFIEFDESYGVVAMGFFAFCCMSSAIYIFNDIMDAEKDRLHPKKSQRPIASGQVGISTALIIAVMLVTISMAIGFFLHNCLSVMFLTAYLLLNIGYSACLKKIPIVDIATLSLFFIIRIYYGATLIDVPVSTYLYLTIMSVAFMMGADKRKKEKSQSEGCRDILGLYSYEFLSKIAQIFMSTSIIFYSLWVLSDTNMLINNVVTQISIFFVIVILLYYQYIVDKTDDGNPVDVLLTNPVLLIISALYVILMIVGFIVD